MATLNGTDSGEVIDGTSGADTINGNGGNDTLLGEAGNDILNGGTGNDVLTGGSGADTLTGGPGADTFRDTAAGLNGDTITDFSLGDHIQITDSTVTKGQIGISGDVITFPGGSVTVTGLSAFNGRLFITALQGGGVDIHLENAATNDFNGDGRSDILWRNDNGDVTNWLGQADGSFLGNTANAYNNASNAWHIVGTGDFNGDGRVDVLWQSDSGEVTNWLGNGNGGFSGNIANADNSVSSSWHVVGTGDFNADGRADVLWRNDNGDITDWLGQANGSFVGNTANAYNNASTFWHVVGTGDFNGDGSSDILWESGSGEVTDWLGNSSGGFSGNIANADNSVASSWTVAGTGDFNGDGITDVLWRNSNGDLTDWLGQANGSFVGNTANAYTSMSTSWHVQATGDYNGDGIDDILWQNDNGTVTEWFGQANGGFVSNLANSHSDVSSSWHVQPHITLF